MNVTLIGATGKTGIRILTELQSRGHHVTAVARDITRLPGGVTARQSDLSDVDQIADAIAGADAVVDAFGPPADDPYHLLAVTGRIVAAVAKAGKARLIVVGGAGSLEVAPGVTLLDSGHLPAAWLGIATAHSMALDLVRASKIDWTYFSPAAFFEPGERTGVFRLGTDQLIDDDQHNSRISLEDYAIALVDELEKPVYHRQRFTIGY